MTDRPPRLFKYQPVSTASLSNLRDRAFWLSAAADFNDPFDCCLPMPTPDFRAAVAAATIRQSREEQDHHVGKRDVLRAFERQARARAEARAVTGLNPTIADEMRDAYAASVQSHGISCFSATNQDILMWSHYANGHRGFCLEFDSSVSPFDEAQRVAYDMVTPATHSSDLLGSIRKGHEKFILSMILTKFDTWKYEQEWRIIRARARIVLTYPSTALTAVYLGLAMPQSERRLVRQIVSGTETAVRQMTRVAGGYGVLPEEDVVA